MNLFKETNFHRQAIILLSAQAPKQTSALDEYSENINQLMSAFNLYDMGQKIIVLGDQCLIDTNTIKDASWLYAYNSAYERPIMTSLQRGISLLDQDIRSALLWPIHAPLINIEHIQGILKEQKLNLNKVIQSHNGTFPMCIPRKEFKAILQLNSELKIDDQLSTNTYFK